MIYHRPTTEQLLNLYQNETVLWACAYDINDDTGYVNLKSLPVKGILVNASGQTYSEAKASGKNAWHYSEPAHFAILKSDGTPRKSGQITLYARVYADTKEECELLFDQLVQKRIDRLQQCLQDARNDKLHPELSCETPTLEAFLRDTARLQAAYRRMKAKGFTKQELIQLVAPFRDCYHLTDLEALTVTREEKTLSELIKLFDQKLEV